MFGFQDLIITRFKTYTLINIKFDTADQDMIRHSLVSRHLSEGLLQLLGDSLVLLLLGHQLVLKPVHLLLQLLHRLVSKVSSGLSLLQLGGQRLDLLLVGLLPLVGLLLGHLQGLEVVGNHSQLLRLLQVAVTTGKILGALLIGSVSSLGLVPGILQILLQSDDPLLIIHSLVLKHLLGTLVVISSSTRLFKLGVCLQQLLLCLLEVLLQTGDSPVESVHLELSCSQSPLLLLELEGDNAEPLGGEVKLSLQLPRLSGKLSNLILGLLRSDLGLLALLLDLVSAVAGIVLLHLHGLHLLLDGVHLDAVVWSAV